jgi:hypothetical protein
MCCPLADRMWGASDEEQHVLQVFLHVDELSMDHVMNSLLQRKLYGLQPGNVLVLPIPRYSGYHADTSTNLLLEPAPGSAERSAGSGVAMLSCGWTNSAYQCDPAPMHGLHASD